MTDPLRTRIIAALEANFDPAAPSLSMVDMADAVIAELGLRRVIDVNRSLPQSRYVTDWEST